MILQKSDGFVLYTLPDHTKSRDVEIDKIIYVVTKPPKEK